MIYVKPNRHRVWYWPWKNFTLIMRIIILIKEGFIWSS
jgi:hypothetical protein